MQKKKKMGHILIEMRNSSPTGSLTYEILKTVKFVLYLQIFAFP